MANWFLFSTMGMEIVFALITLLIAFYSFKVYRIAFQREPKLFGMAFTSIALSYIIWTFMNISALIGLKNASDNILDIKSAMNLFTIGAYFHVVFFLAGLCILAYVTLKSENKKYLLLLLPITILPVLISINKVRVFYSISILFMIYFALHYFFEYQEKKKKPLLIVMASFILLAVGSFLIMLGALVYKIYVIGHVFSFFAYLLLLLNLVRSFKHGKKKN